MTIGQRVDQRKLKIARHETGHAVMALRCGQKIQKVSLKEMDSPAGICPNLAFVLEPDFKAAVFHPVFVDELLGFFFQTSTTAGSFFGFCGRVVTWLSLIRFNSPCIPPTEYSILHLFFTISIRSLIRYLDSNSSSLGPSRTIL
jgi:hypothetical protein